MGEWMGSKNKASRKERDPLGRIFKVRFRKHGLVITFAPGVVHSGCGTYRLTFGGERIDLGEKQLAAIVTFVMKEHSII